jgi:hypothetical protein
MKLLKKVLVTSILANTCIFANSLAIDSIGINVGKSYLPYNKEDKTGSIILGNEPNESFNQVEVYSTLKPIMQVCKDNNLKPYISYSYSKNDDLKHQYILAGVNKYHSYQKSNLYAGVLAGYGQLDWQYDPINKAKVKKRPRQRLCKRNLCC